MLVRWRGTVRTIHLKAPHCPPLGSEGIAGDPAGSPSKPPQTGVSAGGGHNPRRDAAETVGGAGQGAEDWEREKYQIPMQGTSSVFTVVIQRCHITV